MKIFGTTSFPGSDCHTDDFAYSSTLCPAYKFGYYECLAVMQGSYSNFVKINSKIKHFFGKIKHFFWKIKHFLE